MPEALKEKFSLNSEADLKSAVANYLQWQANRGRLWFTRLNAGDFIEARGETRRRIKGAEPGTADFLVLMEREVNEAATKMYYPRVIFLELKSAKGRQSSEQKAFQLAVEKQWAQYFLVRSLEEMEDIVGKEG